MDLSTSSGNQMFVVLPHCYGTVPISNQIARLQPHRHVQEMFQGKLATVQITFAKKTTTHCDQYLGSGQVALY